MADQSDPRQAGSFRLRRRRRPLPALEKREIVLRAGTQRGCGPGPDALPGLALEGSGIAARRRFPPFSDGRSGRPGHGGFRRSEGSLIHLGQHRAQGGRGGRRVHSAGPRLRGGLRIGRGRPEPVDRGKPQPGRRLRTRLRPAGAPRQRAAPPDQLPAHRDHGGELLRRNRLPHHPAVMLLITGGTGFVGGRLLEKLAASGETARCLVRRKTLKRPLPPGMEPVLADLSTGQGLDEALRGVDTVIHLAGVTKALRVADYEAGNARATETLVRAVAGRPVRFLHVSSLAAMGPGTMLEEDAEPRPVSHYGRSKLQAERTPAPPPPRS